MLLHGINKCNRMNLLKSSANAGYLLFAVKIMPEENFNQSVTMKLA